MPKSWLWNCFYDYKIHLVGTIPNQEPDTNGGPLSRLNMHTFKLILLWQQTVVHRRILRRDIVSRPLRRPDHAQA